MMNIQDINTWGIKKDSSRPLLIAGPCSAETEEQVLATARELVKNNKVDLFRAGIWKPRTRPNAFEGVGREGLAWLKKVKDELGLPVCTEVANATHVKEALEFGIDVLWIGARTSANPFAVQEIADTLKGTDIPVLIKNPINPDLDLWIGAIERINNAGITKIGAIHRGFSNYEKTIYRNLPQWQIPIELKSRIPEIAIINDPSHIGGKTELIEGISQQAMDLAFDGLMIETHLNPSEALSDAKQQITPTTLEELIDRLVLRDTAVDSVKVLNELEEFRTKINILDDQLLITLEQRMNLVRKIGQYKKENKITILQNQRWEDIIFSMIEKGKEKGISRETINKVFKAIHQESINQQTTIMNS